MRRLFFWAVVIGAAVFLGTHLADLRLFVSTVADASPTWLAAAAALQACYYLLYSAGYGRAFAVVEESRPLGQMVSAVLAALFVNVVTPTAGAAGPALIIDDTVRRGGNGARAAAATVLAQTSVFIALTLAILPGIGVLAVENRLESYQAVALAVLAGIVAAHILAFVLAVKRPDTLLHVLMGLQDLAERTTSLVGHESRLAVDWAERTAADTRSSACLIVRRTAGAASVLGIMFAGYALDLASLYAIALAFDLRLGAVEVLAAYAVGKLFWIVSPVPQGIGFVEGAMTLVLAGFGQSDAAAGAAALTFRGLSFWLPFLLGMLLLRTTASFGVGTRLRRAP